MDFGIVTWRGNGNQMWNKFVPHGFESSINIIKDLLQLFNEPPAYKHSFVSYKYRWSQIWYQSRKYLEMGVRVCLIEYVSHDCSIEVVLQGQWEIQLL